MGNVNGFINKKKSGSSDASYTFYTIKTDCASVHASIPSISNAFYSATAELILPTVGSKVGTNSGLMNPENQDDHSKGPASIL